MDLEAGGACTRQLWSMTPVGPTWTESMQLGAEYHAQAQSEYYREVAAKNVQMGADLGVCVMRMRFLDALVRRLSEDKACLERQLLRARGDLERRRLDVDQDALARDLWVPVVRSEPDGSWDPPPVLLSEVEGSVTVGGIAAELGFKCTAHHVHQLERFVRDAYMLEHKGCPCRWCTTTAATRPICYTERDRALITAVVRLHGEPA